MVVHSGIPLSEVMKWDLSDIYKAVDMVNMKQDYEEAYHAWKKKKMED